MNEELTDLKNDEMADCPPNPIPYVDPKNVCDLLLQVNPETGKMIAKLAGVRKKITGIKRKLRECEAEIYEKYRWNRDKRWTKDEIEKYCFPKESNWRDLTNDLEREVAMAEYYENAIRAMKDSGWNMRGYIDYVRYLEGEGRTSQRIRP